MIPGVIAGKASPVPGWSTVRRHANIAVSTETPGLPNRLAIRSGADEWASLMGEIQHSSGKHYFGVVMVITSNNWLSPGIAGTDVPTSGLLGYSTTPGHAGSLWVDNGGGGQCEFFDKLTGTYIGGGSGSGGIVPTPPTRIDVGSVVTIGVDIPALMAYWFVNAEGSPRIARAIGAGQSWAPACNLYRDGVRARLLLTAAELPAFALPGFSPWG